MKHRKRPQTQKVQVLEYPPTWILIDANRDHVAAKEKWLSLHKDTQERSDANFVRKKKGGNNS